MGPHTVETSCFYIHHHRVIQKELEKTIPSIMVSKIVQDSNEFNQVANRLVHGKLQNFAERILGRPK